MKIVVSDRTINEFILGWTAQRLSDEAVHDVVRTSLSDEQFFRLLREELLRRQLGEMFFRSIQATTPGQRWDYFNRQKRNATIEAVALPVEGFIDQVKKSPSDAELSEFFEKHKETFPDPVSPTPGFRRPHRIALAYVKADVEKIAKTVTDAEVLQAYEKSKARYDGIAPYLNPQTPSAESHPAPGKEVKKETAKEAAKEPAKEPAKETPKPPAKTSGKETEKPKGPGAAAKPGEAKQPAKAEGAEGENDRSPRQA